MAARIKKGMKVMVISGSEQGTVGEVLSVNAEAGRVVVQGVNVTRRHRSERKFKEAGLKDIESPLPLSKVMPVDAESGKPTRIRAGKDKEGKKIRVAVKSGKPLD
jgi:large subunit ribosomal protein L24